MIDSTNLRLIARLDIKGENLIKGIHLEGLRVVGEPNKYALNYYQQGIDELIYIDSVASLYGRNHLSSLIKQSMQDIFVPLTVGGGIRTINDAKSVLNSGADKIAINTAAVNNPSLINTISEYFGSQAFVLQVDAKKTTSSKWEVLTENGRERSGRDVIEWVQEGIQRGAGEILLTSIDNEGTRKGFDLELIKAVLNVASVPIITSGGMGKADDAVQAWKYGVSAIAMADILHYQRDSITSIRKVLRDKGANVRNYDEI